MADQSDKDQKNKDAILAMKSAQSHMKIALDRIAQLEQALEIAARNISHLSSFLSDNLYLYTSNTSSQKSAKKLAKEYEEEARKHL